MCARIAGRYWKFGYHNFYPMWMQESSCSSGGSQSGSCGSSYEKQGLMLLVQDGAWWIVEPGFGSKQTTWLVKGCDADNVSSNPELLYDLSVKAWSAPYWCEATEAMKAQHGSSWLLDHLQAQIDSAVEDYHELAEQMAERDQAALQEHAQQPGGSSADEEQAQQPGGSSADDEQAQPGGSSSSADEKQAEVGGDSYRDHADDADKGWHKSWLKAGSLNHKVALIGAEEQHDWEKLQRLCEVFLTFDTHTLRFSCII